ncbi:hypothetical protein PF010_g19587 [Phytophthora fragariae]|uniref:Uncharacterized protein n=2 Tax=Phytophthora fragariae TaxID=53985 RepID=A0A6G0KHD8_9STRA|nr:hypothetical protein PF003_g6864 [Phytophthora fragariae]KAE9087823.1 hypothetical protein PF010_g19587 [Phytophthora fragariae]
MLGANHMFSAISEFTRPYNNGTAHDHRRRHRHRCSRAAPGHVTVGYSYNGVIQSISVPPRAIGSDVREALAVELDLPVNGMKLMVLRVNEDQWPTQDAAETCDGTELRYLQPIKGQLEDLPGVDAVQLRVALKPAFRHRTESGSTSSHATTVTKLNSAFTKCRKCKASSQSVSYCSCNAEFMEKMTADLKKTKYKVFIDDILTTCVTAVKDGDKTKADMFLNYEKRVDDPEVDASGTADYVITLGTRMVIVIEAKKCDMEHALRQNFAAMEVAHVLNGKKTQDDKDGTPDTLDHDPLDFPFDMVPIANRVYTMLKLL